MRIGGGARDWELSNDTGGETRTESGVTLIPGPYITYPKALLYYHSYYGDLLPWDTIISGVFYALYASILGEYTLFKLISASAKLEDRIKTRLPHLRDSSPVYGTWEKPLLLTPCNARTPHKPSISTHVQLLSPTMDAFVLALFTSHRPRTLRVL